MLAVSGGSLDKSRTAIAFAMTHVVVIIAPERVPVGRVTPEQHQTLPEPKMGTPSVPLLADWDTA